VNITFLDHSGGCAHILDSPTFSAVTGQTKNVLAKVDNLLEQAGTSKSNLLTASIWLKEIDKDFKAMNTVWNEWLDPDNKPVRWHDHRF